MLVLWTAVMFIATGMTNIVKSFQDTPLKVEPFLNGVKYPISYWTERGGRPYQEDRYVSMKGSGEVDSSLYGIFDGHGGYKAAQYCKENMLAYIANDNDFEKFPTKALIRAFYKYDMLILSVYPLAHSS